MRILSICGAHAVGGAENASLHLGRLLQQRGHVVAMLCRAGTKVGKAAARSGLRVHDAPLGGSFNLRAWRSVTAALREQSLDIALVTTVDEWVWACLSLPKRTQTRLVLARHMVLPLSRTVRWLANRHADAVVAVSQAVRRGLEGIRPNLLHVIPVAPRFAPRALAPENSERARARTALGLPEAGRWVGFFGGLDRAKGIDDVLQAVAGASSSLGDVHVLVGGVRDDEQARARMAARVRTLGLDGRCHHLGHIEKMETALTAPDVVVLATRQALGEAMPLTLLEAMACGTPVAAYAVGGVPEIIGSDRDAGRLVRPDDPDDLARALVEVLSDRLAAQRLALGGLQRVRDHFDPERMADRWEGLFDTLVGRNAPGHHL